MLRGCTLIFAEDKCVTEFRDGNLKCYCSEDYCNSDKVLHTNTGSVMLITVTDLVLRVALLTSLLCLLNDS